VYFGHQPHQRLLWERWRSLPRVLVFRRFPQPPTMKVDKLPLNRVFDSTERLEAPCSNALTFRTVSHLGAEVAFGTIYAFLGAHRSTKRLASNQLFRLLCGHRTSRLHITSGCPPAASTRSKAPVASRSWQESPVQRIADALRSAADYFNNLKDERNLFAIAAYFLDSGIAST